MLDDKLNAKAKSKIKGQYGKDRNSINLRIKKMEEFNKKIIQFTDGSKEPEDKDAMYP